MNSVLVYRNEQQGEPIIHMFQSVQTQAAKVISIHGHWSSLKTVSGWGMGYPAAHPYRRQLLCSQSLSALLI